MRIEVVHKVYFTISKAAWDRPKGGQTNTANHKLIIINTFKYPIPQKRILGEEQEIVNHQAKTDLNLSYNELEIAENFKIRKVQWQRRMGR